MTEPKARVIEGKKFMWDGRVYENSKGAKEAREEYEKENFETRIVQEDDKVHVYSRRVVGTVEGPSGV